jgi:hypothetical protein
VPGTTPPLARVASASIPGDSGVSQDRLFTLPNAVIVLDGASSPQPQDHDGGWYADALGHELLSRLEDYRVNVAAALAEAIAALAQDHDLRAGISPSSTVAILRWDQKATEALVLGDSPIVARMRSGEIAKLADDRLTHIGSSHRMAYLDRLHAGGGFDSKHRELLAALVDEQRRWRNQPGGYWIAEADSSAAHQAIHTSWPLTDVAQVLVVTDGVADGVEQYGQPASWPEALRLADRQGLQALCQLVQQAESSDPNGRHWPRSKRHDDKTAALVTFSPSS